MGATTETIVTGAGTMLICDGKILLVKSVNGKKCWGPPKGQIEPCETLFECAVRETSEETGYDVSFLKENKSNHIFITYSKNNRYVFYIFMIPKSYKFKTIRKIDRKEVSKIRWFPISKGFNNKNMFQKITRMCFREIDNCWIGNKADTKKCSEEAPCFKDTNPFALLQEC